jgi:anti-sigma regulatory factor (Ser/Thr protein kinase)
MLGLERRAQAAEPLKELKLKPALEAIPLATAFVETELESAGAPGKVIARLSIAVDEILSNIARYSGAAKVTVGIGVKDGTVVLRFADNGMPYDPTQKPDPDTGVPLEEREAGGLGIFMVKQFMDSVEYVHQDGLNILTLQKKLR